jgi:integral membrane sensor domain MASE1
MAAVAVVYFATAKLGLDLASTTPSVTAIWPPTGVALAALVLGGRRLWPAVAVGAFAANATTDVPLYTAAGIAIGNTLEAVVGASLLAWAGVRPSLDRLRDVFGLAVLAGVISTTVSATIGVASLSLGDSPFRRGGCGGSATWAAPCSSRRSCSSPSRTGRTGICPAAVSRRSRCSSPRSW